MGKREIFLLSALIGWIFSGTAMAGNSDTQVVSVETSAINEFALSTAGTPITLNVSAAAAGSQPGGVINIMTTYAITTNSTGADSKKITASLDSNVPANTTLKMWLLPCPGAVSTNIHDMSTTVTDMVTGIEAVAASGIGIFYRLDVTVDAGVVASTPRTATYTLTDT